MKNLSVRVKMILLALITLVGTLAIVLLSLIHIYSDEEATEKAIKECIDAGCNIIFTTSWGYMETTAKLDVYKRQEHGMVCLSPN